MSILIYSTIIFSVIWNPWEKEEVWLPWKITTFNGLDPGEYKRFVCVGAGVLDEVVKLIPRQNVEWINESFGQTYELPACLGDLQLAYKCTCLVIEVC